MKTIMRATMAGAVVASLLGTAPAMAAGPTAAAKGRAAQYTTVTATPAGATQVSGIKINDRGTVVVSADNGVFTRVAGGSLQPGKFTLGDGTPLSMGTVGVLAEDDRMFGGGWTTTSVVSGFHRYLLWNSPTATPELHCTGVCPSSYVSIGAPVGMAADGTVAMTMVGRTSPVGILVAPDGTATIPAALSAYATSRFVGIAADGTVLGNAWSGTEANVSSTFTLREGVITTLPTAGAWVDGDGAVAISSDGRWAVGRSGGKPVLWNLVDNTVTVLGSVPADFRPVDVNNAGEVVGMSGTAAYIIRSGRASLLSSLTKLPKGTTLCDVRDINNLSQVAGLLCTAKSTTPSGAAVLSPR